MKFQHWSRRRKTSRKEEIQEIKPLKPYDVSENFWVGFKWMMICQLEKKIKVIGLSTEIMQSYWFINWTSTRTCRSTTIREKLKKKKWLVLMFQIKFKSIEPLCHRGCQPSVLLGIYELPCAYWNGTPQIGTGFYTSVKFELEKEKDEKNKNVIKRNVQSQRRNIFTDEF